MSIPTLVFNDGTPMRTVQLTGAAKEIYDEAIEELNAQIKTIDNISYKEVLTERELKTYISTIEWEDDKKYLILYGTGSFHITTGHKGDTDEEIIRAYREKLKKTLR